VVLTGLGEMGHAAVPVILIAFGAVLVTTLASLPVLLLSVVLR
jgi:hypothetical protein